MYITDSKKSLSFLKIVKTKTGFLKLIKILSNLIKVKEKN